jgi:hypothetical protein
MPRQHCRLRQHRECCSFTDARLYFLFGFQHLHEGRELERRNRELERRVRELEAAALRSSASSRLSTSSQMVIPSLLSPRLLRMITPPADSHLPQTLDPPVDNPRAQPPKDIPASAVPRHKTRAQFFPPQAADRTRTPLID